MMMPEKGWRCCDPTTGKCHTSINVVFSEASSWWPPKKIEIPEYHDLEEVPEELKEKVRSKHQFQWKLI